MVFDFTEPSINLDLFPKEDWTAVAYGECIEELPVNMPEAREPSMVMRAFVDSDHAGDTATRRSRTHFIIFLNNSPICWFSKCQTSVETSSFGSEFVAMKLCCEYIRGLRYKLRRKSVWMNQHLYLMTINQSLQTYHVLI